MCNRHKGFSFPIRATAFILLLPALTWAAPPEKDVNVVNTPNVIVANPGPIPVTIDTSNTGGTDYVSVGNAEPVNSPTSRITLEVFHVPAGKIFIADYISIHLDVVVRNRPSTGLRIAARLDGNGTNSTARYELGYMEEFVMTSRGTPNFIMAREVKTYFTEGPINCVGDTHFAGSDLDFGIVICNISGRLIDAP